MASLERTTLADVEEKYGDPFHLLIACVISLRTKDAVTREASLRLFERVSGPAELCGLDEETIGKLIYPAGFYKTKARQLKAIGCRIVEEFGGQVPSSRDELLSLPGVGRKTANLVLGLGFDVPAICVDTHVHRISNRLGWADTNTPEETERVLERVLPRCWWIPVNDILVTFGQTTCLPRTPRCSACPLKDSCPRVGVEKSS